MYKEKLLLCEEKDITNFSSSRGQQEKFNISDTIFSVISFNTTHDIEMEKRKSYQHHQSSSLCQLQICQQHVLQGTTPVQELLFPKISEDTSMHSCSARSAQNEPPYQGWNSHHRQCPAFKHNMLTRIGISSYSGFTMAFLIKRSRIGNWFVKLYLPNTNSEMGITMVPP